MILVDGSNGIPQEWKSKYKVPGFPTIIFTDVNGKEIERLGSRSADAVAKQMTDFASKYSGLPWSDTKTAFVAAKKDKRPVLVWAADPLNPSSATVEKLFSHQDVKELIGQFNIAKVKFRKKDKALKELGIKKGMVAYIYYPGESSKAIHRVIKISSVKRLKKGLESGIKKFKAKAKKEA